MQTLQYTKSHPDAQIFAPQKPGDAGFDLCIVEDVEVGCDTKIIDSHIAVSIPEGYVGLLFLRSSAGIKKHLRLANHVGIIDSTFRGTMKFALYYQPAFLSIVDFVKSILSIKSTNSPGFFDPYKLKEYFIDKPNSFCKLEKGERICQLVIVPYASLQLQLVDKLPDSERGTNGIGSTGK